MDIVWRAAAYPALHLLDVNAINN